MYSYIKGILTEASPGAVILEAHGVGYSIYIPVSIYSSLPPFGKELQLHVSFIVRDQLQALYGFLKGSERDFFEHLIGVSGIGPKTALSLMGHLPMVDLQNALSSGDTSSLVRVPGIGKKTAERLVVELRDKASLMQLTPSGGIATHLISDPVAQKVSDAVNALVHLGYNQMSAQRAVKKIAGTLHEEIDLSDLITHALKHVN